MSTKSSTTVLPYVAIAARVRQFCAELGLPAPVTAATPSGLPENKGWMFMQFSEDKNAAALIVQKTEGKAPNVHSHLDLAGHDGYIPLPKYNGRVLCHFECDLNKVKSVLHLFVASARRPIHASRTTGKKSVTATIPGLSDDSEETSVAASEPASYQFTEEELDAEIALINGLSS
jgi:hypothetical protein